jgi:hypothetical protein
MPGNRLADEADVTIALALANGLQQNQCCNCAEGVDCGVVIVADVTDAWQRERTGGQDKEAKVCSRLSPSPMGVGRTANITLARRGTYGWTRCGSGGTKPNCHSAFTRDLLSAYNSLKRRLLQPSHTSLIEQYRGVQVTDMLLLSMLYCLPSELGERRNNQRTAVVAAARKF